MFNSELQPDTELDNQQFNTDSCPNFGSCPYMQNQYFDPDDLRQRRRRRRRHRFQRPFFSPYFYPFFFPFFLGRGSEDYDDYDDYD